MKFNIIVIALLVLLNILVFLPSVKGDFIWDDRDLILENPFMQSPSFFKHVLFSPFDVLTAESETGKKFEGQTHFYRPLTITSYRLDFLIWGFNPWGFHLTNILIHTLNSILLFFIVAWLGFKVTYAFFSAALFSLYPLHFENTAWISGRTDLLSFLFAAAAVLFFLLYIKKDSSSIASVGFGSQNKHMGLLLLSAFCFFLSLLAKENCFLLPVIFFLFLRQNSKPLKKSLITIVPYLFFLVTWLAIRQWVLNPTPLLFSQQAFGNMFTIIGFYTFKSLFPFHLSFSIETTDIFSDPLFLAMGLLILAGMFILGVFFMLKKRLPTFYLAIVAFYLLLLPSLLVLFVDTVRSDAAWRFLYAPSAVLIGLLIYGFTNAIKSQRLLAVVVILLGLVYVSELYPKNVFFGQKERDFWTHMENIERESLVIQYDAAAALLFIDEKKALAIFNHILEKAKDHPRYEDYETLIQETMAAYYSTKGDFQKAKYYYECVLKRNKPGSLEFYFNYAHFLYLTGNEIGAKSMVADLLRRYPGNHKVLIMAAKFYIGLNMYERAIPLLKDDYRLFKTKESLHLLNSLISGGQHVSL